MFFAIPFPPFLGPVAFHVGPLTIHWYGLAYAAGYLVCWHLALFLAVRYPETKVSRNTVERFLIWALIGGVLGGRLGYVLFYQPAYYLQHPLESLALWQGGMSFHGGLIGFVCATIIYARRVRQPLWPLADIIAVVVPIGLGFGRLANFVNQELYGRASQVSWAVLFPASGDGLARHPSQLYEALLEGLVLFCLLVTLYRVAALRRRAGTMVGVFFVGYGPGSGGSRGVSGAGRAPGLSLGRPYHGAVVIPSDDGRGSGPHLVESPTRARAKP